MFEPEPTEKELLKTVLEPLLEDFQYWFSLAQTLLESERLSFFSVKEQMQLLARVKESQQQVTTAQILFKATGEQVGIDPAMMVPWHKLVAECWQVSLRWRSQKQKSS